MTVEEFAAGPAQSDLLKKEEVVEIFLHFTVNPKVIEFFLPSGFNLILSRNFDFPTNPDVAILERKKWSPDSLNMRQGIIIYSYILGSRPVFNLYYYRWGYSGTCDRVRFTVSRRIFVVGFGLYGSIHGPTDYRVNIQVLEFRTTTGFIRHN